MVRRTLEQMLYTCGSKLDIEPLIHPPSAATVFTRVMVRLNLTCNDPVEIPYYSSECFEDICVHCACQTQCTIDGQYPICNDCKGDGKLPVFKRKRKLSKWLNFCVCIKDSFVVNSIKCVCISRTFLIIFNVQKKKKKASSPHWFMEKFVRETSNFFLCSLTPELLVVTTLKLSASEEGIPETINRHLSGDVYRYFNSI